MLTGNQFKWRSTEGLRTALTGLFVLVVVANLAEAFAYIHRIHVIDRLQDGTATVSDGQHADELVHTAGFVALSLVLTIAVVFIVWQWRTAKNAEILGRTNARYGPGWSIGAWFIPLANLVIPVEIMQDLWRSSDPESSPRDWRRGPRSVLVGCWWAAIIVSGLFGRGTTDRSTLSGLRSADNRATFGVSMISVAAILALAVVRSITARQIALRASLADTNSSAAEVRCASCGKEYIAGTVLCPECLSTDFRPIAET